MWSERWAAIVKNVSLFFAGIGVAVAAIVIFGRDVLSTSTSTSAQSGSAIASACAAQSETPEAAETAETDAIFFTSCGGIY